MPGGGWGGPEPQTPGWARSRCPQSPRVLGAHQGGETPPTPPPQPPGLPPGLGKEIWEGDIMEAGDRMGTKPQVRQQKKGAPG